MEILFGIIGTALLCCVGWFVFLLNSYPRAVFNMTILNRTWSEKVGVTVLLVMGLVLIYGAFQVSYSLLGWMPSDWGHYDLESEEWETARYSVSSIVALWVGFFLGQAIGTGIKARLSAAYLRFEIVLREKIDQCFTPKNLDRLAEKFNDVLANGSNEYSNGYAEGYEFLKEFDKKLLDENDLKKAMYMSLDVISNRKKLLELSD